MQLCGRASISKEHKYLAVNISAAVKTHYTLAASAVCSLFTTHCECQLCIFSRLSALFATPFFFLPTSYSQEPIYSDKHGHFELGQFEPQIVR